MPISVKPGHSDACLVYRFSGQVTPEDFDTLYASEELLFAALPTDRCLGIIADFSDLETIGIPLFSCLQQMRLVTDRRSCAVFVVGANSYLRALAISLEMTSDMREFTFCSTLEEAQIALQSHPRLNPSSSITAAR